MSSAARGGAEERAIARLQAGQPIYQLPSGQRKFGGNKFIPNNIASKLDLEPIFATNRGWIAHRLAEKDADSRYIGNTIADAIEAGEHLK